MLKWARRDKTRLVSVSEGKEVWNKLGLYEVINRACSVDRAGETVLELLLLMPDQELFVLGLQNVRELIAITTWYLWWIDVNWFMKESLKMHIKLRWGLMP